MVRTPQETEGLFIQINAPGDRVTITGRIIPDTEFFGITDPDGMTFGDAIIMKPSRTRTARAPLRSILTTRE